MTSPCSFIPSSNFPSGVDIPRMLPLTNFLNFKMFSPNSRVRPTTTVPSSAIILRPLHIVYNIRNKINVSVL
ncbi:hypothetical protein PBCV1_a285R [Paramecium bursaria Chlorella virus 1]|uniref:Uncharacterized protein n=1 Tax=Paramecium bursaria Chlorella virus 1 TaxID=10506 RepID=Q84601_PBCV1|nr:hypothetical protein PBCV1_a285R [Paramecium bursaria Chlorella virus 1]AAC96653.1 hypothetical protein [Paramecium bursaria Chlorella virus 1]